MRLYRPVGVKELELIARSGWKSFPPRLAHQPIFYPVLNFDYASAIAEKWNVHDANSEYAGFVTEFDVEDKFVARYEIQTVGGRDEQELWIPADELEEFNTNIEGEISGNGPILRPSIQGTD